MRPKFLAEAETDLLEAALWYEDRRENLGLEFHEAIIETCQEIGRNPARFPAYECAPQGKDVRRAIVNRFPYVVIFEDRQDGPVIIAVAHSSRDSRFWLNR